MVLGSFIFHRKIYEKHNFNFNAFISKTNVYEALKEKDVIFTIFVPNNTAMMLVPKDIILDLMGRSQSTDKRRENVALYHMTQVYNEGRALGLGDLGNRILESSALDTPKLYLRKEKRNGRDVQFVNGAEIIETIPVDNGMVHIIDRFLHRVASRSTALSYIRYKATNGEMETRTKKFDEILKASESLMETPYFLLNSEEALVTVFVPSDRALSRMTTEQMAKLKSDPDGLIKLINRHVIASTSSVGKEADVSAVWHASLLELKRQEALREGQRLASIPAQEGHIKPISVNKELYVSNSCGRVKILPTVEYNPFGRTPQHSIPIVANITVSNGVIHLVDGLLGYIHTDAYITIRDDERVRALDWYIRKAKWESSFSVPTGTVVRADRKLTVFVPINDAIYRVERADESGQLKENITYIRQILSKHVVREQFSLTDIVNGSSLVTLDPNQKVYFRQEGDETYVTVDHVEGRIVVPDICVENGILHYIDVVLGVPYQTVFDTVSERNDLKTLYKQIRRTGLEILINNRLKPVTFFAPNEEAFEHMNKFSIGRTLLGDDSDNQNKFQKVLLAHAAQGYFFTDEMTHGKMRLGNSQLWLFRQDDGYYIERRGDYETVTARIIARDIKTTNGVVYTIDRVLYQENGEAYRAIPVSETSLSQSCILSLFFFSLLSFITSSVQ